VSAQRGIAIVELVCFLALLILFGSKYFRVVHACIQITVKTKAARHCAHTPAFSFRSLSLLKYLQIGNSYWSLHLTPELVFLGHFSLNRSVSSPESEAQLNGHHTKLENNDTGILDEADVG
jgi:hypothetical protein